MPDNVTLNPGSQGATLRALADGAGVEWPVSAVAFATTVSPGGNVLVEVTPVNRLPVALSGPVVVSQDTAGDLLATVSQGGSWTVAATQSGPWDIGAVGAITTPVTVSQPIAADLLCTASQGGAWTVAATQSGTWTANQGGSWTVAATQSGAWNVGTVATVGAVTSITDPVTVISGVAGNFLCTASQGGSWTVAATQNGTWNVGVAAGTSLIGKASIGQDTGTIYNRTTALTPKFAVVTASSSGNTQVVAAVTGKKIRVLRWSLSSFGTVNAAFRSGASTQISGVKYLIASAAAGGAFCPVGVCETAAGEALNINLTAGVAVSGELTYVEV